MAENEAVLLKRFSTKADAEAFAELVQRYARLVYSTSWRILKQENDAADVTQQTFFELTRHASRISGSLSGWLHRVATQKSIDFIRRSAHRRQREQVYARNQPVEIQTWEDLSGHVDEALDTLDAPLKALLLDRFLAGKTTVQIAREQGLSQATVSRRINDGLQQLRGRLRRQGLLVAGAALGTMLMENTSQAVPLAVLAELSKMAMVGTTGATASLGAGAVAATKVTVVKAVLVTAVGAGLVTAAGALYSWRSSRTSSPPSAPMQIGSQALPQEAGDPLQPVAGVAPVSDSPPAGDTHAVTPPAAGAPTETGPFPAGAVPAMRTGAAAGTTVTVPADQIPAVELMSAESAMYSFLSRLAEGARDKLVHYVADGAENVVDGPFLYSLGYPVALIDIRESGDRAEAVWSATACRDFHLDGQTRSAGESLTLASRLNRVNGLWRISSISPAPGEEGTK